MPRPSPALIVSVIALIAACAGSAGATALITSKDVKDHSLQGKDIRSNTITGRNVKGLSGRDVIRDGLDGSDIDESTLDKVPSAARADSAGTADAVKGMHVGNVAFRAMAGTAGTPVFDEGGLRLQAACAAGGLLTATATPSGSAGGVIRIGVVHPGTPAETTYVTDNDFTGADSANLVAGGAGNAQGHLTYTSPAGDTITVDYLTQDGVDPARGYACLLAGTAVHTTP